MKIDLLLQFAIWGSWVTTTKVIPRSLTRSLKIPMISFPVSVSKAPVGSSANITRGLATIDLAIATRCCCPVGPQIIDWGGGVYGRPILVGLMHLQQVVADPGFYCKEVVTPLVLTQIIWEANCSSEI